MGYTGAHCHSGTPGWCPARWPEPVAFGSPCQRSVAKAHPERTLWAARAHQCAVTVDGGRLGAALDVVVQRPRPQGLQQSHPHYSSYMLLYWDLDKVAGKGVLTGEVVGRRRPMALRVEMVPKSVKVLLARLPRCKQAHRTLGQALLAMRSNGECSHHQ
jgi:hypothetical protein